MLHDWLVNLFFQLLGKLVLSLAADYWAKRKVNECVFCNDTQDELCAELADGMCDSCRAGTRKFFRL